MVAGDRRTPTRLFFCALCFTALLYWPGLHGGFLFDDFPNLEKLGARGPIRSFELLWQYLSSGFSGPTGRPLSLLTFLLDANDWPADPWPFKRTNLIIHLMIGLALYHVIRQLLLGIGRSSTDASWIALLATTLWLVNPFLVSTTLYTVQRMTQLSALFVLGGVACYLHGRALLVHRPRLAYLLLIVGMPLLGLAALLSKETGALLPLLVLAIHWTLREEWVTARPPVAWVATYLLVPSLLIAGFILSQIVGAEQAYAARSFTLEERLLTQPRFLWDYLYHLAVPHIQTQGLYQDGRVMSASIWHPWTTLPALVGLATAAALSLVIRRRFPLVSLGILFFLAAHALESSTIALEPYFEHRNYLPAAFMFVPLSAALLKIRRVHPWAVSAFATALVSIYGFATWQRATLWGDGDQLILVWAATNPDSARAQISAAQVWLKHGRPEQALAVLEAADKDGPNSALLATNRLAFRAELGVLSLSDLESTARDIRRGRFDAEAIRGLEQLVKTLNSQGPLPKHAEVVHELLRDVGDRHSRSIPSAYRMTLYLRGLLLAGQGNPSASIPYFIEVLEQLNSVDSGLRIVSELALLGHYDEALHVLGEAEALLANGGLLAGGSKETYEREIARVRGALLDDLQQRHVRDATAEYLE